MQVVIYYAGPKGVMYEKERFDAENLMDARHILADMFRAEHLYAEWNVRTAWISETMVEGHVYGYCRDERVDLVLEDDSKNDYLTEEYYIGLDDA